jgi:hypothetical protein
VNHPFIAETVSHKFDVKRRGKNGRPPALKEYELCSGQPILYRRDEPKLAVGSVAGQWIGGG